MASINGFEQQVKMDKWIRNLEDDLKAVVPFIEDKKVTDIWVNNGVVSIKRFGKARESTELVLTNQEGLTSFVFRLGSSPPEGLETRDGRRERT